jgi:SWI/SNF-related matrix-associated actin-dependent regulator of chromatin subfamily A3
VNAQLQRQTWGYLAPQPILGGLGPNDLLTVSLVGDYFELSHANYAFARLDKCFCGEARRLIDLGVNFHARVDRAQWETIRKGWASSSGQAVSTTFAVDVSVYSRRNHADRVGDILLRSNLFLQHPAHHFDNEDYYNPQILELEGFEENPDDVATKPMEDEVSTVVADTSIQSDAKPSGASTDHVELILDSLSHKNILHEIRTDTNLIKSELMKYEH